MRRWLQCTTEKVKHWEVPLEMACPAGQGSTTTHKITELLSWKGLNRIRFYISLLYSSPEKTAFHTCSIGKSSDSFRWPCPQSVFLFRNSEFPLEIKYRLWAMNQISWTVHRTDFISLPTHSGLTDLTQGHFHLGEPTKNLSFYTSRTDGPGQLYSLWGLQLLSLSACTALV